MERHPVESRLIRAVGYDLAESILEIELAGSGRVYRYFDIPYSTYLELLEADSKGGYFNDSIRDLFPFEEDEAVPEPLAIPTPQPTTTTIGLSPSPPEVPRVSDWSTSFAAALPYLDFLDKYANPNQRGRWDAMHGRITLAPDHAALLGSFVRRMPVLVMAGAWCGDCVNQCTIFDHFARSSPAVDLRFIDRDAMPEVAEALSINGGHRVPSVLFLSEDFQEVARYGERTLAAYRQLAVEQLGPACPTGLVPPSDEATRAVLAEWLDQFERAQLILRLSPKYRAKYSD